MRLISNDIKKATASVLKFIPSRPSHPILANIKLVCNIAEQTVTLTAFNLSDGCTVTIPAVITDADGDTTLPSKLFSDIISKVTDYEVELIVTVTSTKIKTKSGNYEVRGMPVDEYPELEFVGDVEAIALQNDVFFNGVNSVLFSVSNDETKQVLTGVKVTGVNGALAFASTDGHRLSVTSVECEAGIDVVIPGGVLRNLSGMMAKSDTGFVLVQTDGRHIVFESEGVKVVSRLLESQYPNYQQLLPTHFKSNVDLNRREFIAALERVSIVADYKNGIAKFDFDDLMMTVSAASSEIGEASEMLTMVCDGEPVSIAINVKYVVEALKSLKSDNVKLRMNTATSPFIIVPDDGANTRLLVMPVQIRS